MIFLDFMKIVICFAIILGLLGTAICIMLDKKEIVGAVWGMMIGISLLAFCIYGVVYWREFVSWLSENKTRYFVMIILLWVIVSGIIIAGKSRKKD